MKRYLIPVTIGAVAVTTVLSVMNISAYAADRSDTERHTRATVRDPPARLAWRTPARRPGSA